LLFETGKRDSGKQQWVLKVRRTREPKKGIVGKNEKKPWKTFAFEPVKQRKKGPTD